MGKGNGSGPDLRFEALRRLREAMKEKRDAADEFLMALPAVQDYLKRRKKKHVRDLGEEGRAELIRHLKAVLKKVLN